MKTNRDKNNQVKIELLAPGGGAESVYAAVSAGCDAVYLGGRDFSARSGAENFETGQIARIIDYCHLRGVKVYITANTMYKEQELSPLLSFVSNVYAYGADALILQDIGTAAAVKKALPDMPLHASTQMTAHSLSDVLFLRDMGFDRVVLSRELSLDEIKRISGGSDIELECFVHGALCVCYSGQCLMSSFIGGRSGNRGKCAQPCRLKYELLKDGAGVYAGHLLSPKDILALDTMQQMIAAGVTTFKIEGRMKTPEYAALATKAYRERLDAILGGESADTKSNRKDEKKLLQIFNRGGFSQGYFTSHSGKHMMSTQSPKHIGLILGKVESYAPDTGKCVILTEEPLTPGDGIEIWTKTEPHAGTGISAKSAAGDRVTVFVKGAISAGDAVYKSFDKALSDEARRIFQKDTRQIIIGASVKARQGEALRLTLCHEATGTIAEARGETVAAAQTQPMTEEKLISQLSKTGGTPFSLTFTSAEIDAHIFVPIAALNEIRRNAVEILTEKIPAAYRRRLPDIRYQSPAKEHAAEKELSVLVSDSAQTAAVLSFDQGIRRVYLECTPELMADIDTYAEMCSQKGIELYLALPDIDRSNHQLIDRTHDTKITGYLVRTLGQLYALKARGSQKAVVSDYTLNISNRLSYDFMRGYADVVTLSQEINFAEINAIGGAQSEIVIHGKTKLMTTAQCPIGIYAGNKGPQKYCALKNNTAGYCLKDRTDVKMPVKTNCDECIAYIYNDRPVFLLSKTADLAACAPRALRLSFTDETAAETRAVLRIAVEAVVHRNTTEADRRIRQYLSAQPPFTYGHFYKGAL